MAELFFDDFSNWQPEPIPIVSEKLFDEFGEFLPQAVNSTNELLFDEFNFWLDYLGETITAGTGSGFNRWW